MYNHFRSHGELQGKVKLNEMYNNEESYQKIITTNKQITTSARNRSRRLRTKFKRIIWM